MIVMRTYVIIYTTYQYKHIPIYIYFIVYRKLIYDIIMIYDATDFKTTLIIIIACG